jgi:hypothetical protein
MRWKFEMKLRSELMKEIRVYSGTLRRILYASLLMARVSTRSQLADSSSYLASRLPLEESSMSFCRSYRNSLLSLEPSIEAIRRVW